VSPDAHDLLRPLLTHEIGSLGKPGWRVKGYAGRPLDDDDVDEARRWGKRLEVDEHDALIELLQRAPLDDDGRRELRRWSSRYAIRFFEAAGLDVVYDGEQQRSEMYAYAVRHAEGFEFRGSVRSFDDKYYSKAAVTGPIGLGEPYHDDEFEHAATVAHAPLKIPVTGPYTIAIWSFDERYRPVADLAAPLAERRRAAADARRSFVLDVARDLIRPNLESLIARGARWIQLDEPAASTDPGELDLVVDAFNACVDGLDATFSTHLCFSDYDLFFPAVERMAGCEQYAVGFANYDRRELGTSAADRPGYAVIERFRDLGYEPALGLGVLDIHTDFVEPPELVRDRILHAVDVFGGPERIHVTPDCGLRTRTWDVAFDKLRSMVAGVELAADHLGI
jgi:5-methyltetrahydropteroyltriglutamate--homocysteine methyltransferase